MPPLAPVSPASAPTAPVSASAGAVAGALGRICAPPRAAAAAAAAPRDGPFVARLVVVPRTGDGRGGETTLATARTLPADAAVGLLSRERSTFRGTLGGTGGGGALRDLASEAAVGANRPDEGREGRETTPACFDDGVFGREPGAAAGVGDLAVMLVVIERGKVDGALRIPVPFDGVRGVGVLERAERVAVAVTVGGRAPGDDVDFDGDAGVLADLGGAV